MTGLAVELGNSRARVRVDIQRRDADRAGLAAALIDSVFSSTYQLALQVAPISHARVTTEEVRAVLGHTPFAAVLGASGRLLASWPRLPARTVARLLADPSVRMALAGHSGLSNLVGAIGPLPAEFLTTGAYKTPYGRRVTVSSFPLAELTALLAHYLSNVAYETHARVYLVDGNNVELGSSAGGAASGTLITDRALLAALGSNTSSGFVDRGSLYYSVGDVHVAPWRVLYTVPTAQLYGAIGYNWTLSFLLLAGFGLAACVCLFLLVRLHARSAEVAQANVALAQRNREVEQANQAKSRFLANMSHELRTPLNAIIGFAELMRDERLGPVSAAHAESLDDIRSSALHLLHLINEVLDLARIESGRITLDPQEVDPIEVAADCVDSLRAIAGESGLHVTLETQPLGVVMLDPARLRQVLLNYLSNAIKFTPGGGHVRVTLRPEEDELVIAVADTGPGIAAEDQARLFDEFEQLPQPDGRSHRGTGLGLAVTKRIVEAQHGSVGVYSVRGRGSTFWARLPLVPVESVAVPHHVAAPAAVAITECRS